MARKHSLKRNHISAFVPRTLVSEPVTERKIVLNPVTNEYEVKIVTIKPGVYKQGKAADRTVVRGNPNAVPSKIGGKK